MATDRHDIVIFGASGFTGQFVVEEVARIADEESGLTWAIAGRSMEKLQKVLSAAGNKTGKDLESVPIIVADTSSETSMVEMCQKAKIVLNCVGPYRFHGEKMVKAALEGGASHIDISGEPEFLENMQLMYHGKAKENGVYIVGSCGFDSIPADMGVAHAAKVFKGVVNSVESFFHIFTGPEGMAVNTGTLESAVFSVANASKLRSVRKSLFPEPLPPYKYKLKPRKTPFRNEIDGKYTFDFLGSDKSVVYRTQRHKVEVRKERPIQYTPYVSWTDGILGVVGMMLFGAVFMFMSSFSLGRTLMLKFPSFFTGGYFKTGGPSKKQMENCGFTMIFVAKGWNKEVEDPEEAPDTVKITKVTGPEIGYVTTPICMVQAAIVMLKEKDKLPEKGGVYTPAGAFMDTTLIERLNKHNVRFEEVAA